jgi:hypothetical protein
MEFVESYRKLTRMPKPEIKSFKVSDLYSRVKVLTDSLFHYAGKWIGNRIEYLEADNGSPWRDSESPFHS